MAAPQAARRFIAAQLPAYRKCTSSTSFTLHYSAACDARSVWGWETRAAAGTWRLNYDRSACSEFCRSLPEIGSCSMPINAAAARLLEVTRVSSSSSSCIETGKLLSGREYADITFCASSRMKYCSHCQKVSQCAPHACPPGSVHSRDINKFKAVMQQPWLKGTCSGSRTQKHTPRTAGDHSADWPTGRPGCGCAATAAGAGTAAQRVGVRIVAE